MKDKKKTEIKVGVSVIVAILISIFVIAWAKNLTLFSDPKELKINFNSVAGLDAGDVVTINGVRKGYIKDINLSGNNVQVTASLDEDAEIKKDAKFSIMMLDLMGGKKLEISPGNSTEEIDYSATHNGIFLGDISTAMAMLSGMESNIKEIVEELSLTLNSINKIIGDDQFSENVKTSVMQLNELTNKVSRLITENRAGIKNLIDSTNSFVANSNSILTENKESIKLTLDKTVELIDNSSNLVSKLDSLMTEIKSQENTAGKLLYDESFYLDLKNSMENVKKLTRLLIDQLEGEGINVDANLDLF